MPPDPDATAPATESAGVAARPEPPPEVSVHDQDPRTDPATPVPGMPDQISEALHAIEAARTAAAADDAAGTIRALRGLPEPLLLADGGTFAAAAKLVASAARLAGYQDLADAAHRAGDAPDDAHALYGYGYSCVERGVAYLAVPALMRARTRAPEAGAVRMELVSALESESRHAEAVEVLVGSDAMEQWTGRYLLVINSLMAGDIDGAHQWYARLGKPPERRQEAMEARLTAMLARVHLLLGGAEGLDDPAHTPATPDDTLGSGDLRGWHFALNGGLLTTLSPYGADVGMGGRYAYLAETYSSCHWALHRLALVLAAAGRRPPTVGLLQDRSSRILGMAAAEVLGVRAWDWRPQMEGALVVSYSLADAAPHVLNGLSSSSGQILVEHATCWTEPSQVAADATTFLHQVVVPPWAARQVPAEGGDWVEEPPDLRPEREIAAEILAAPAVPDPGDGSTAEDTDDALAAFAERVASLWAQPRSHRDRVWSPGPVRSSRFW